MIGQKRQKPTRAQEAESYELVTLRDQNACQMCLGDCGPVARDHRQNRSQGGLTVVENLQLLGLACHEWKTNHGRQAAREGWGVPGWADPAEYPARRFVDGAWVWVLYVPVEGYDEHPKGYKVISEAEALERINNPHREVAA